MHRVAKLDVARPFESRRLGLLAKILFGLCCALAMIGFRVVLDLWIETAGPFALVYPTVLIAVLFGHWQAGLTAFVTSFMWAWYFVLAPINAWGFVVATDPPRVAINAAAVALTLVLAEAFRRAVVSALEERDREIDRAATLQAELEHRTKNNFALAASLLEMQKRREQMPEVAAALEQAIARIHSFASAYSNLALRQGEGAMVAMQDYLVDVVDRVTRGAFLDNVKVEIETGNEPVIMPRETAVAIGLFTNEALTNCAKYAFPDGRDGVVKVRFDARQGQWSLAIEDDGVGDAGQVETSTGIGERLFAAFAQQAQADYRVEAKSTGRALHLASRAVN
ncbi:sensor histidine kinase [Aurantiacibacter poecillastricola]|uniref:sensor histidine kinase n=1 Tax=Aurantiacibacter poecillastricola TaxID=3064385 RepID=UPI00273EB824|nr:sensor histidine kinase [Aurantiacibacter sp. 219JJ12-13]MDP5260077.1 sensor histidine kinase [Aurantiacibacter sp. 219JJ12-13]